MATRSNPLVVRNLEKLEVLIVRDLFMKVATRDLEKVLIRTMNITLDWVMKNLTKPGAEISLLNFRLPLQALYLKAFRSLYIQAFELGAEGKARPPVEALRFKATLTTSLFISRIERDLKESWKRAGSRNGYVLVKTTKEVFFNAIS